MKKIILSITALLCAHSAFAQLISNPVLPTPAAQGVGGAYTASARGTDAILWNPAGLGFSSGSGGRFAYQQPYSASFLSHLAAGAFTTLNGKAGAIGISLQSLSTRLGGETMSSETEISVAHGLRLQQDIHTSLAFGYALKLINWNLGESVVGESGSSLDLGSATTFGLDVGVLAQVWDRFYIAGAFKNINHPQMGANMKRDLPRVLSAGLAYEPYYGVRTTLDIERSIENGSQFKLGTDLQVVKPFHLRVGTLSNPNVFTAGFGLFYRDLVVDYAFLYHPILAPSHNISIGFDVPQTLSQIWNRKS
jgi:hypothetical protein